ncbi:unnamed protein product [Onchocerca ochengi]|uniref:Transmembrane protein 144 n=1 Tax=Onchocerca ochengi TaxID=42157 RepID=A0A182E260_ONCOC|nr:unnamed protein product [Onchocerca ochengi]
MNETLVGFTSCIISCIAFGFMFAPLRNFDCKDGNIASVPIINHLGIGVGMLVWSSVQVLIGWGVARFGFFGTRPQSVYNNTMNVVGLFFVLLSGFMFVFVKHKNQQRHSVDNSSVPESDVISMQQIEDNSAARKRIDHNAYKPTSHITKKKIGYLGLAVFLGILHGLMMTPIVYIQDTDPKASPSVLDYVFPHFCAVFFCSTIYFIGYCIWMRGRTHAPAELILPSAAYGVLWCIGMTLWFVSNRMLSQTVSFPITTRLPSTIGVLADVLLFKDVKGKKNLTVTFSAVAIGLIGVLLIAFSNQ